MTELQVWQLRLTLHFLSDSGNLLDCASLAAMTALRHFRRPEVEVIGDEVILVRALADQRADRSMHLMSEHLFSLPYITSPSASPSHTMKGKS